MPFSFYLYSTVYNCDLCNINLPLDQNSRGILCAANYTRVKIDLWSSSNTAEISLKYLTCCNRLRATISYVCSPSCSLLYWVFLEVFPDVMQLVKSPSGHLSSNWSSIFQVIRPDIVSISQQKCGLHPPSSLHLSQILLHLKN